MRIFLLYTLLSIAGCTTLAELDALCDQGDEVACDKAIEIEAIQVRRERCKRKPECPEGTVAYRGGYLHCWSCVDRNEMMRALGGGW